MSKRVAIYTKVATCATEDRLLLQLEACRKYDQERGWAVVAEVADKGVSGTTLDRPGLNHIRDMVQAGEIDGVIVYALDRLAREVSLIHLLGREFRQRDVEIHCTQIHCDDTLSGYLTQ